MEGKATVSNFEAVWLSEVMGEIRSEGGEPCPKGHGPEWQDTKGNGRRVCYKCAEFYRQSKKRKGGRK